MSQAIPANINPATTSGTQLATLLNSFKDAIASGFSGTARPPNLQAWGYWIDTTNIGSPNFYAAMKVYTGTTDVEVIRVNVATNTASISGSSDSFSVTRISADTAGAILSLKKERVASNGQVVSGDTIGDFQFIGSDNADTNPIVGSVKVVATDTMTVSAAGSYMVFSATYTGQVSLVEMMRLVDGKLGIGVTAPVANLHARGNLGARIDRRADDLDPAVLVLEKQRIAGTGAAQINDIITRIESKTIDSTSAEAANVRMEVIATEAHTGTNKGVNWRLQLMKTGTSSLIDKIIVGVKTTIKELLNIEALELVSQNVATAATIAQLNGDKILVELTGSTATNIQGINSTGVSKVVLIHNRSTATVIIKHQDAGATAADRFKLPKSKDITLYADSSIEFYYCTTDTRWKLKSGSGGGGGELTQLNSGNALSIADGGAITLSAVDARQLLRTVASGTTGLLASLPFGAFTSTDPVEVILVGDDTANPIFIPYNDANGGVIGNFEGDNLEVSLNLPAKFLWVPGKQRFYASRGV